MATGTAGTTAQTAQGPIKLQQGTVATYDSATPPALEGTGTGAGDDSVQAANYLVQTGASTATQTLGNADNNITLQQHKGTSGLAQAGNLIDVTGSSGILTATGASNAGGQVISTTGRLKMDQLDTGKVLQAGNAVLSTNAGTNGGTLIQKATVGELAMLQTKGVGSFQAANYLGVKVSN